MYVRSRSQFSHCTAVVAAHAHARMHAHARLSTHEPLHAHTHARTYTHVGNNDAWESRIYASITGTNFARERKTPTGPVDRPIFADHVDTIVVDTRSATGVVRGAPFPRSAGKVDTVVGVELGDILSAHGRYSLAIASRRVVPAGSAATANGSHAHASSTTEPHAYLPTDFDL